MLPLCDSTSLLIHEATDTHMPFEVSASLSKRSPEVVMEKTLAKGHSTPAMADEILTQLNANSIFDLRGVVAVVTGGGTVRLLWSSCRNFDLNARFRASE